MFGTNASPRTNTKEVIIRIFPFVYAAVDYASLESIEFQESLSVIGLVNKSRHSQRLVSPACRMAS
jgi:hypothetical protein